MHLRYDEIKPNINMDIFSSGETKSSMKLNRHPLRSLYDEDSISSAVLDTREHNE